MKLPGARAVVLIVAVSGMFGCRGVLGQPTESVCSDSSSLTYENFAKPFMEKYCTDCHSSQRSGSAREGAPTFHDFDTLFGIKAVADHVDLTSAAGPAATNTGMPPESPYPTQREREQLGEWIACGLP